MTVVKTRTPIEPLIHEAGQTFAIAFDLRYGYESVIKARTLWGARLVETTYLGDRLVVLSFASRGKAWHRWEEGRKALIFKVGMEDQKPAPRPLEGNVVPIRSTGG